VLENRPSKEILMLHKKPVAVLVACSLACFSGWAVADGDKPAEPTTAPAHRPTEEGQKKPEVLIYRSPALDKLIARTMDVKEPLAARLENKLVDARLFENRVLIFAAARKSDACQRFFSILLHGSAMRNGDQEASEQLGNFTRLAIDTSAPAGASELKTFFEKWHLTAPAGDDALLAVVDPDGQLIAATTAAELWPGAKREAAQLTAFLKKNEPPVPDAQKRLADALAQARSENKRVFVEQSANWCGWCHVLARYLDQHRPLVEKDYVWITVDERFTHAADVMKKLRPKAQGGIPWVVILDADGKPLITSDASEGNIGYPSEPKEIEHFEKMLRTTAQHMSDAEIKILMADLLKK
jgi:hypothetical protein